MQLLDISLIISAYLLGSLSSAIIVCKMMGLPDPRTLGSNNPGATNVLRFGGKKAAVIALLGDMIKGAIPVLIAKFLGVENLTLGLVGFAAFIGHLYPVFFNFKGGKGVATAFGVYLALYWQMGLVVIACWLIVAKVFRISSLAALIASAFAPVIIWYFTKNMDWVVITLVITVMLTWRHRSNIQNLISGSEDSIGTDADER